MARSIRIATWNANGLRQHKAELEIFLEEQKIDVCLISETHLTRESYLKIHGFKIYHTIHPTNKTRGGAGVIIRANIRHYEEITKKLNTRLRAYKHLLSVFNAKDTISVSQQFTVHLDTTLSKRSILIFSILWEIPLLQEGTLMLSILIGAADTLRLKARNCCKLVGHSAVALYRAVNLVIGLLI